MNLCPEREKAIRLLRSHGDSSETGVYMCDFFFVAIAFTIVTAACSKM